MTALCCIDPIDREYQVWGQTATMPNCFRDALEDLPPTNVVANEFQPIWVTVPVATNTLPGEDALKSFGIACGFGIRLDQLLSAKPLETISKNNAKIKGILSCILGSLRAQLRIGAYY